MRKVQEVMTAKPRSVDEGTSILEAAKVMKDESIGDVIITRDGHPFGILTDRDIIVRAVAEGKDLKKTTCGEICSVNLSTTRSDSDVEEVVTTMRTSAIRRVPVVDDDRLVGVVSIGDLAIERDRNSALADISAAPANR